MLLHINFTKIRILLQTYTVCHQKVWDTQCYYNSKVLQIFFAQILLQQFGHVQKKHTIPFMGNIRLCESSSHEDCNNKVRIRKQIAWDKQKSCIALNGKKP